MPGCGICLYMSFFFMSRIVAHLVVKPTAAKSHNRVIRQDIMCTVDNNTACLPDGISVVPSNLITCSNGDFCICNECFERGDDGRCQLNSCDEYFYDESERECVDDRPSQLTAFLLSLFLSSTGAANFYIGRDDLGTCGRIHVEESVCNLAQVGRCLCICRVALQVCTTTYY